MKNNSNILRGLLNVICIIVLYKCTQCLGNDDHNLFVNKHARSRIYSAFYLEILITTLPSSNFPDIANAWRHIRIANNILKKKKYHKWYAMTINYWTYCMYTYVSCLYDNEEHSARNKCNTWWSDNVILHNYRVMVFNATFNNISVILWGSVLLVKETGVPGKNQRPVVSHWQT